MFYLIFMFILFAGTIYNSMETIDILIVCILLLLLYIIVRWIHKTARIAETRKEGMEVLRYPTKNAFTNAENLPLKEYSIYASFNTAYDGTQISLKQLGTIMYGGCRFIDLNIFYSENELYVGFANDNAPTMVEFSLKLSEVVEYLNSYAFTIDEEIRAEVENTFLSQMQQYGGADTTSGQTIQKNYVNYPLFVNLRVYRPPASELDIVKLVSDTIIGKNGLQNLYREGGRAKPVNQYTRLNDIRKKIIVCMDYQNILQMYSGPPPYDPTNISPETIRTVENTANIQIGSNNWRAFYNYADIEKNTYNMLEISDARISSSIFYETNTNTMKIVYPYFTDTSNPNSLEYIEKFKIQTVPHRFYISDTGLTQYINMFNDNKTPFLPLYYALRYIRQVNPVTLPVQ